MINLKEQNLADAMENMKMIQDLTINTSLFKNSTYQVEFLRYKEMDLQKVLTKRFAELTPAERVVLTLHLINQ